MTTLARKWKSWLIAATLLGASVTSCSLSSTRVVQPAIAAPTPAMGVSAIRGATTVLRIGTGDSGEGLRPHQAIISQFERNFPDISVQLESVASSDYYADLLKQIAAGTAPDIMQIGDDAVPMFVQQGALVELDPYIKGQYPLDAGIYLPGVFQPGAWQGRQYLLPKDYSPLAVYYNKRLFIQYNVPYPKDGWTWDDFLKTAQALTHDTDGDGNPDVWGVQLPAAWPSGFEYWVAAAGGELISEDGKKFEGYLDGPAATEALQFYANLYNLYKVAPPPVDIETFGGGNAEFEMARAGMLILGRWPQSTLLKKPNIEMGVVGMPVGKTRANVLFWSGFGIWSGSQHKEEAWRFLRFYAGENGAKVWKDWALPTVRSVAESSGMTKDPIEGVWFRELNYLAPRAFVFTPYWGQTAEPALREAMERVILDPNADIGDALRQAARQAQAALDAKR